VRRWSRAAPVPLGQPQGAELLAIQSWKDGRIQTAYNVTSPAFDAKTRTISATYKARAAGDCGTIQEMKWTGWHFRLLNVWSKDRCDGEPFEWDSREKWQVFPRRGHEPNSKESTSGHDDASLAAFRDHGADLLVATGGIIDPDWVLSALAERQLRRVLCEGGPSVHRDLLAAGRLDELSLTLAPSAVGGVGHRSTAGDALPERADFDLTFLLLGEDQTVFTSYRRRR